MLSRQDITDVILSDPMEPGILIKVERIKRGWSQAELGKRAGISQVAVKKIESGATKKSKHLPKLGELLDIPLRKLDASLSQVGAGTINHSQSINPTVGNQTLNKIPIEQLMGEMDLPAYSAAEGGNGALVLENEPSMYVSRPRGLFGKKKSYAVQVVGDSMAREYNAGDIAYVDPYQPPKKNDPCVFQGIAPDGTALAIIKYLERSPDASETLYYVSQTNPPKKFTIKKADWQKCHLLVGKESGR